MMVWKMGGANRLLQKFDIRLYDIGYLSSNDRIQNPAMFPATKQSKDKSGMYELIEP